MIPDVELADIISRLDRLIALLEKLIKVMDRPL